MRVVSLFSGIEGFGLGLRMAGLDPEIVLEAEIDPFAQTILARRFPGVPILSDVREVDGGTPAPDVLTAGFPCQPVSQAGLGKAQKDERWLWPEVARIIGLLRPPLVLVENVRGLLRPGRGMGDVLRDLAGLGYGAQWDLLPALANGAAHLRHRVWIVAYPEERPIGRVFDGPPFVFPFPPDPAELDDERRIPRLTRGVPKRRERLTALGNAVVPQAVASVMIYAQRALTLEPLVAPTLFAGDWPGLFPKAGALIGGVIVEMPSTDTGKTRPSLWPTPSASDGSGGRVSSVEVRETGQRPSGTKAQRTLGDAVSDAEERVWPTPKASPSGPDFARAGRDGSGGDDLATSVARYETGRTRDQEPLWQTPTAAPWSEGGGGGELVSQIKREQGEEVGGWSRRGDSPDDPGRSLNPPWVEWLMGYPLGWTDPEA